MEQSIRKTQQGKSVAGEPVWSFYIPNSTNDYIELSTFGCSLQGLHVHDRTGTLCNLVQGMERLEAYEAGRASHASLLGGRGGIPELLAHKVWEVVEEGRNYVFLACRCTPEEAGCGLKAGAKVMWVNLNRLVVDFFLTPEKDLALTWSGKLLVRADTRMRSDWQVRSFCPETALPGKKVAPVAETAYANQRYGTVTDVSFLYPSDDVKPMAELACLKTGMHLSVYGSFRNLQASLEQQPEGICLTQWSDVSLKAGESFAGRVIYGIDYLNAEPETAMDPEAEPNPFAIFGGGI